MRKHFALAVVFLAAAGVALPQGTPLDWPLYGGDAQRTGWEKVDIRITKDNVKDFQLVLKRKLENKQSGPYALSPPVVIGRLISYKGFKELAFVSGSGDNLWSIDADMNKMFWVRHFDTAPAKAATPACSAVVTSMLSLTPPANFANRPRPGAAGAPPANRSILTDSSFGAARPAFAVSSDGKLHLINTSIGEDVAPAMDFIPAGAKASPLTVLNGVVYTTTRPGCGVTSGGVWAMDLNGTDAKVASLPLHGGSVPPLGGLALGTDGTVYVQTGDGPHDPAANQWSNTLLALSTKDLKVSQYFTSSKGTSPVSAPVVFAHQGRDLIVTSGSDGRIYLLDSKSLGGDDHKTPLFQTPPLSSSGQGVWGGLSTWQDPDGTRWILAPVWGPLNPELKALANNGAAPNGFIVAFRLEETNGKLVLTPAWVSRDMLSPLPPVIASGFAFALSAGEYSRDERPKNGTHATLYALDATTGKEVYSSGNQVTAPGALTGVSIANGRVFFTTTDNTLYGFGIFLER